MASLIIEGSKSISISNRFPNKSIRDESIFIEDKDRSIHKSYLFFDLCSIPANATISSAQLVLFRKNYCHMDNNTFINICPLKDDFSTYTTYRIQPKIYDSYKKVGEVSKNKVSVEVDITEILKAWLNGTIINKGLVIEGNKKTTPLLIFGSTFTRDEYLMPIIRVIYDCTYSDGATHYLPVTINYANYENPAIRGNNSRLIIAVVVTIGDKNYNVSKEYASIPSEGTDTINVAYMPEPNTKPIVSIAYSYCDFDSSN